MALAGGAQTEKMKFGHHGANHPVQDIKSREVFITSQNHGFAVNENSIPENIEVSHVSLFDNSIQGINFKDRPAFSFQGHPEASPGPQEISSLFLQFKSMVEKYAKKKRYLFYLDDWCRTNNHWSAVSLITLEHKHASYEEGFRVILVNSNPATIMTDPLLADATYIEPITGSQLSRLSKRKTNALLPTMGGQTGLNTALTLAKRNS